MRELWEPVAPVTGKAVLPRTGKIPLQVSPRPTIASQRGRCQIRPRNVVSGMTDRNDPA